LLRVRYCTDSKAFDPNLSNKVIDNTTSK